MDTGQTIAAEIAADEILNNELKKMEKIISEAIESMALIIDSLPPGEDLSTVIVNAIAEGKIKNLSVNY